MKVEEVLKGLAGFIADDGAIGQTAAADGVAGTGSSACLFFALKPPKAILGDLQH